MRMGKPSGTGRVVRPGFYARDHTEMAASNAFSITSRSSSPGNKNPHSARRSMTATSSTSIRNTIRPAALRQRWRRTYSAADMATPDDTTPRCNRKNARNPTPGTNKINEL